jgi:hypothetical protein
MNYLVPAFLVVAIVVISALWWWSRRGAHDFGKFDGSSLGPTTQIRNDAAAAGPLAAPQDDDFDPNATQIYMRPPSGSAGPARPRKGESPRIVSARLVGISGSVKGQSFPVAAAGISIGRHPECDVIVADPRVSSRHAWIGIVAGKAMLRDLKSTNGTFLNTQTRTSVSETELRSGDMISFGGHQGDQFRFVAD